MLSKKFKKSKKMLFVSLSLSTLMFSAATMSLSSNFALTPQAAELNPNNTVGHENNMASQGLMWNSINTYGDAVLSKPDGNQIAMYFIDRGNMRTKHFRNLDGSVLANQWLKHPDNDGSWCYIDSCGKITTFHWISSPWKENVTYLLGLDGKIMAKFIPDSSTGRLKFFSADNTPITNELLIHPENNGSICFIGENGEIFTSGWFKYPGNLGSSFANEKGEFTIRCAPDSKKNGQLTFWNNGKPVVNKWIPSLDNTDSLCFIGPYSTMDITYSVDPTSDNGNKIFKWINGNLIRNRWLAHPDNDGSLCFIGENANMLKSTWISDFNEGNKRLQYLLNENGKVVIKCFLDESKKYNLCFLWYSNNTIVKNYWLPHPDCTTSKKCLIGDDGTITAICHVNPNNEEDRQIKKIDGTPFQNVWLPNTNGDGSLCLTDNNGKIFATCHINPNNEEDRQIKKIDGTPFQNVWLPNTNNDGSLCLADNDGKLFATCSIDPNSGTGNRIFKIVSGKNRILTWLPNPDNMENLCLIDQEGKIIAFCYTDPNNRDDKYFTFRNGSLISNQHVPHPDNDAICITDGNGHMIRNVWGYNNGAVEFYLDENGKKAINTLKWNPAGFFSYFGDMGVPVRNGFYPIYNKGDTVFYFSEEGKMIPGCHGRYNNNDKSYTYYDANGNLLNCEINYGNTIHKFRDGKLSIEKN